MDVDLSQGKGGGKQKKMNVRVDFTPMVDMMMLLITFFMLCTSLAKPQTMELAMPAKDKNQTEDDAPVTKASQTITIYLAGNDKIYYVEGLPNYNDPTTLKETTWGAKGIRDIIINHQIEDGTVPVQLVMQAKAKLDEKKLKDKKFSQEAYDKELSAIKAGNIDGQKIPTLTIIIKPTDKASYKNVVDALDEMQICSIGKYVIDKFNPQDTELLKKRGVE